MEAALSCVTNAKASSWSFQLPWVEYAHNSPTNPPTHPLGCPPSCACWGTSPPGSGSHALVSAHLELCMLCPAPRSQHQANRRRTPDHSTPLDRASGSGQRTFRSPGVHHTTPHPQSHQEVPLGSTRPPLFLLIPSRRSTGVYQTTTPPPQSQEVSLLLH